MWARVKAVFSGSAFQLNDDDIVVFVVGPSGGGKTWFVSEAINNPHINASGPLRPSTAGPVATRCGLTDEAKASLRASRQSSIVFVETPSFDIHSEKDKAKKETERWLKMIKSNSTRVGAIYIDRLESSPAEGSVQDHLNAFASTFPKGFKCTPTRLRVVLSYDSTLTEYKIQSHKQKFQAQLVTLRSSFTGGRMLGWDAKLHSELFVNGNRAREIAWNAVKQLFLSQNDHNDERSSQLSLDLQGIVQSTRSSFDASLPLPPDLTPFIIKNKDHSIGGGGFGDVYKCWYINGDLSKEVAVKAFRFRFVTGAGTGNSSHKILRRELGIWKKLDHQNVVPFLGIAYGFGMQGVTSLVSLWMPNGSLQVFLAKYENNLGTGHRLQLLLDTANGLHHLHSQEHPIVHGDLTSTNVLIDADYTARLIDFGFTSIAEKFPEAVTYLQVSTARPGALRFIAPEQVQAEGPFKRTTESDIFSFGCVALQVLSGKQPWSEVIEDVAIVLRLAKGHRPDRPQSRIIDEPHWDLIQRCWSSIIERPSAKETVSDIQRFLDNCPPFRAFQRPKEVE
ncbi:kinase-like domain-containing protein [Chiua virens]|nr:kinase-like domain-containing protein [Chiua virens]